MTTKRKPLAAECLATLALVVSGAGSVVAGNATGGEIGSAA